MVDHDKARDVFRRRVGTRAKRIALLCTQLYEKPMTQADKRACAKWIAWWMEQDINGIMIPFGNKYTKAIEVSAPDNTPRRTLFERLPDEFSKDEHGITKETPKTPTGAMRTGGKNTNKNAKRNEARKNKKKARQNKKKGRR